MTSARGLRVLVTGPDGSGKSTVVNGLRSQAERAGWKVVGTHFRPRLPRQSDSREVHPHGKNAHQLVVALIRVVVRFLEFARGFAAIWRRRRGTLTLVERGWWDQTVDPVRYRLPTQAMPLVGALGWFLPRFDVAILCDGDATIMSSRKNELSPSETDRQLREWRLSIGKAARRGLIINTTQGDSGASILSDLTELVERRPGRWRSVPGTPPRLNMRVRGRGVPVVTALDVYQPLSTRGKALKTFAGGIAFLGIGRPTRFLEWDILQALSPGLTHEVAAVLASNGQKAFVARTSRSVIKFSSSGATEILHELEVLKSLPHRVGPARTPRVLAVHEVPDFLIAVEMEIFRGRSAEGRKADQMALDVAIGLARQSLTHGDFVPWNLLFGEGDVCLIDWQRASLQLVPGWDLLTWHVQSATHLRPMSARTIASAAITTGGWLREYCHTLNFQIQDVVGLNQARIQGWTEVAESSRAFANETLACIAEELRD